MRQRLILLVIAALLPLIAVIGVLSFLSVSQKQAAMRDEAIGYSAEVLQSVTRELRQQRQLVEILARSPALDAYGADLKEFHTQARRFLEQVRGWDRVILTDLSGQQVVNTAVAFGAQLPGLVDRESFDRVLLRDSTIVSNLTGPGPLAPDTAPWVAVRTPVKRAGATSYILTVLLQPDVFKNAVADARVGPDWRPFLIDGADRLVAVPRDSMAIGLRAMPAAIEARSNGLSGVYAGRTRNGDQVITAFTKSPETGWSAHISIPQIQYNAPLKRSLAIVAGLLLLGLGLSATFAIIARRVSRAIKAEAEVHARATRMEALGRMTGGVAHDFNNLLMVVTTAATMLRKRNVDASGERFLSAIQNAADRGTRLTRQLMTFSRGQSGQVETFDTGLRLTSIKSLIRQSVTDDIVIEYDVPDGGHFIAVDPVQFDLSIINVVVNARDAMPGGGRIGITLKRAPFPDRSGRTGLLITISDTGTGIAPKDLPYVFEPFYTTKDVGKGTGLGLSQVYGFVKAQGGLVEIESEPGAGARVMIYLPEAEAPAILAPSAQADPDPQWRADGLEAVVVDDNDDVRVLTGEVLADMGFRVRHASNASEALALCEAGADLVVSDIVMPGSMDGVALARTIRQRWPDMQTILMTGYSEASKDAVAAGLRVLGKPFTRAALLEAIRTERFEGTPRRRRTEVT
ncbi:MAG: response regulator [Beijerinckiaceae bacterium]|nr:response regulator [Beijerinckiaceae bacterium]